MRFFWLIPALFACACGPHTASLEDLQTRTVRLPGGREIRAEVMMNPVDMQRGMMYRDSLPPDRGMLFIHTQPGLFSYWMYNVKIPLDIIWMDANGRVVEIVPQAPPCTTRASECPHYGGTKQSQYVLELAGGEASRNGIQVGSIVSF